MTAISFLPGAAAVGSSNTFSDSAHIDFTVAGVDVSAVLKDPLPLAMGSGDRIDFSGTVQTGKAAIDFHSLGHVPYDGTANAPDIWLGDTGSIVATDLGSPLNFVEAFFWADRYTQEVLADTDVKPAYAARIQSRGAGAEVPNTAGARHVGFQANMFDRGDVVTLDIASVSNTTPVVITTVQTPPFFVGERVAVDNSTVPAAADGVWLVQAVNAGAKTVTLQGSVAGGAGGAGGIITDRGPQTAFEASVAPAGDHGFGSGSAARFSDDLNAYVAYNGGTGTATDAFYEAGLAALTQVFQTAFTADRVIYALRAFGAVNQAVVDAQNATLGANGHWGRMMNLGALVSRNAAGSAWRHLISMNASNQVLLANDGDALILTTSGGSLGFFGGTPRTKPAAITARNASAFSTGGVTALQASDVTILDNMRTRINEIESRLNSNASTGLSLFSGTA